MMTAPVEFALVALRMVDGHAVAGHGGQTLFRWFGGRGLSGFSGMLHRIGL